MDNLSTKVLGLAQKKCERRLVGVETSMLGGTQATERRMKNTARRRVVVKLNTVGGSVGRARCRHRKVVQNPHSVKADTHDYFLRRPKADRLRPSSKSGPDMIISCGDLRLVGSTRHQKVVQNPYHIYY